MRLPRRAYGLLVFALGVSLLLFIPTYAVSFMAVFIMLAGLVLLLVPSGHSRRGIGLMFLIVGIPMMLLGWWIHVDIFDPAARAEYERRRMAEDITILLFVLAGFGLVLWPQRHNAPQSRQNGPGGEEAPGP